MNFLHPLFRLPRRQKRLLQLAADSLLIAASFLLAMLLRLDSWAFLTQPRVWWVLPVVIPMSLLIFIRLGFYRAVIRYMSSKAIRAVLVGVVVSALTLPMASYLFHLGVPRFPPFKPRGRCSKRHQRIHTGVTPMAGSSWQSTRGE